MTSMLAALLLFTAPKTNRLECKERPIVECAADLALATERNFIIPDSVARRRLTIIAGRDLSPEEAFKAFVVALDASDVTIEQVDGFFKLAAKK